MEKIKQTKENYDEKILLILSILSVMALTIYSNVAGSFSVDNATFSASATPVTTVYLKHNGKTALDGDPIFIQAMMTNSQSSNPSAVTIHSGSTIDMIILQLTKVGTSTISFDVTTADEVTRKLNFEITVTQ